MNETTPILHAARADALKGTRHVFVKDLEIEAVVGVHEHEKLEAQRLFVTVDLTVREGMEGHQDNLKNVVCYGEIVRNIQDICDAGHVNLLETLAEKIAGSSLQDRRVLAARVRIEKPDIIKECAYVGIEIERLQPMV